VESTAWFVLQILSCISQRLQILELELRALGGRPPPRSAIRAKKKKKTPLSWQHFIVRIQCATESVEVRVLGRAGKFPLFCALGRTRWGVRQSSSNVTRAFFKAVRLFQILSPRGPRAGHQLSAHRYLKTKRRGKNRPNTSACEALAEPRRASQSSFVPGNCWSADQ